MPKRNRHSKSKRKRNRARRQHQNSPSVRVKRGGPPLAPEIKLPEDGDWAEEIARAGKELRVAHAELR